MQACGFISNILAARIIAILGLFTLVVLTALVALDFVVIFPAGYHMIYTVYNITALILSLFWLLALAFGAFRFNIHALTVSILAQIVIIIICVILATVILFVGMGDYRDHELPVNEMIEHDDHHTTVVDANSSVSRDMLIGGLFIYAVLQAFFLFVTICTRNDLRRSAHTGGGIEGGYQAGVNYAGQEL